MANTSADTFYVTTPIYYVNSHPHLGHLYTTLVADTLTRFNRQLGKKAFFLTGTDEHGVNIERAAEKAGIPVQAHVDSYAQEFQAMVADFGLEPSRFIRTTDPAHEAGVAALFNTLKDAGHIYKGSYKGIYCGNCNQFYTETEAKDVDGTPTCPVHDLALDIIEEESYFFRLSAFQDKLLAYYEANPEFIQPQSRMNEMKAFVSSGLQDLSISRVSVKWGIPVPGDPEHTLYVWLDALSNYITALGYGNDTYNGLDDYWPANLQLVGKDILRFHTVFWPAFLMGAGLPLPKAVFAHGMWLSEGRKMSKTLGNVIDLKDLKANFSLDAIRYFCLREMAFGGDADFNYPALIGRINGDLAGGIGNLASRSLTLVRSAGGMLGTRPATLPEGAELVEETAARVKAGFLGHMADLNFHRALETAWELIGATDRFIAETKPWALIKDPAQADALAGVFWVAAESLRHLAVLLAPIMPESMQGLWSQLGLKGEVATVNPESLTWGEGPAREIGEVQGLFPRLNQGKLMATLGGGSGKLKGEGKKAKNKKKKAKEPPTPTAPAEGYEPGEGADAILDYGTFLKTDIRVGLVLDAEPHPKADRLIKLMVDVGEPSPRQICAGLAPHYGPEDLKGARVLVVANLAPRKLRGLVSQGMILAASEGEDGQPFIVEAPAGVPPGGRVR